LPNSQCNIPHIYNNIILATDQTFISFPDQKIKLKIIIKDLRQWPTAEFLV